MSAKGKKKLKPEELFNEWWSNEIDYGEHKFTEKERVAAYHGYMVGYNKASEGKTVLDTDSKCNKHIVTKSFCDYCESEITEKESVWICKDCRTGMR